MLLKFCKQEPKQHEVNVNFKCVLALRVTVPSHRNCVALFLSRYLFKDSFSHLTFDSLQILFFHDPTMLRALGGKLSKMTAKEEDLRLTANLKSFKDVSKLGKVKLKQICKNLGVDIEKSFGKKALVNVACNALGISTSSTASRTDSKSDLVGEIQDISSSKIPSIKELQKLNNWRESLLSIPQLIMDEALVKEFLLGVGYSQTDVRKYKTLRAWQHKQGIHSVK